MYSKFGKLGVTLQTSHGTVLYLQHQSTPPSGEAACDRYDHCEAEVKPAKSWPQGFLIWEEVRDDTVGKACPQACEAVF